MVKMLILYQEYDTWSSLPQITVYKFALNKSLMIHCTYFDIFTIMYSSQNVEFFDILKPLFSESSNNWKTYNILAQKVSKK